MLFCHFLLRFCKFTGYSNDEIEGQNCRFLQGESTKESDINIIRKAIKVRMKFILCTYHEYMFQFT